MPHLSTEQARFYRTQGYFKLPGVYSRQETSELRDFVFDQAEQEKTKIAPTVGNVAMKMYGLYQRNPELLHRMVTKPELTEPLQSIAGPNIVMVTNRHNHATINNKQGEPAEGLHRDILQPSRGLLTAAVYLQTSTIENGATRILPGSHELPYVGVPQANGGGTWMSEHGEYAGLEQQAIPIPMEEGDVLLFNGLTFHGVGSNPSGEARASITLGFRSIDELDAQPDESRELLVAGEYIYRGNDM